LSNVSGLALPQEVAGHNDDDERPRRGWSE
jgi:hypothetical protein